MQIRSRLAGFAQGLADWLQPPAKGAGQRRVDPLLDRVEPAEAHALPSAPWLSLGERLRNRSLKTLRAEALYAVAALHQAHEVAAAVLRERVVQRVDLDPAQRVELAARAEEWARDATTLNHALGVLSPLQVPDAPLAAYLDPWPQELDAIEGMMAHAETLTHRALVSELLE